MRMFIAALLGAAALLPSLVRATTTLPDPSDASASVPALSAPSAFADYQPYRDEQAPSWQELNRAVTNSSAVKGMSHGAKPNEHNEHSSTHEGPAK